MVGSPRWNRRYLRVDAAVTASYPPNPADLRPVAHGTAEHCGCREDFHLAGDGSWALLVRDMFNSC